MAKVKDIDIIDTTKWWLKTLEQNRQAVISLREMLEEECDGLQGIRYNGMPSAGKIGDPTSVIATKRDLIEQRLRIAERHVHLVEMALGTLSDHERILLERKYVCRMSWSTIISQYHYSERSLKYQCKRALVKVSFSLFGVNE